MVRQFFKNTFLTQLAEISLTDHLVHEASKMEKGFQSEESG